MEDSKKRKISIITAIIIVIAVIIIDQVSKIIVFGAGLEFGETYKVIPFLFNVRLAYNPGASFGFLSDWEGAHVFFIILTALISLLVAGLNVLCGWRSKVFNVALSFIFGGAMGNLSDRLFTSGKMVRDFISFDFWQSFPTFNMADSFIVIGIVLLCVYVFFFFEEKHLDDVQNLFIRKKRDDVNTDGEPSGDKND